MNNRGVVMACVLAGHGVLLAAVWTARRVLAPLPAEALTIAVYPTLPATPMPRVAAPLHVTFDLPNFSAVVLPAVPAPAPLPAAPAPTPVAAPVAAQTAGDPAPQVLGSELAVQCPDRAPPRYPPLAKRQREQGEVRLRVELDPDGRIAEVTVIRSSEHPLLDAAAVATVRGWHCLPAQRDGHPVAALATQTFDFVLERR